MASTISAYDAAAFQGCILSGVPFTFMLLLFVRCFQALWKRIRSKRSRSRRDFVLMAFICFTFSLGTTLFITNIIFTQSAFLGTESLTEPMFPPIVRLEQLYSSYKALPLWAPLIVVNWCGNFLMIWRCAVIYQDCRTITKYAVFVVPLMILLATIVFGTLWILEIVGPLTIDSPTVLMNDLFAVTYFSSAIALSTVLTILITARLLLHRQRIIKTAGKVYTSQYTNITMIIVESSLLYSSFSLLYLVPLTESNAVRYVFLQMLGMIDVIASFLIIYRVLAGKGWSSHSTVIPSTTIRFGHGPENNTYDEESNIESLPLHLTDPKAGEFAIAGDVMTRPTVFD